MKLRLSNGVSDAQEFDANNIQSLRHGIQSAFLSLRERGNDGALQLQVKVEDWISANYPLSNASLVISSPLLSRENAQRLWQRLVDADGSGKYFDDGLRDLTGFVSGNDDDEEK
jgi:hypothetical protein